MINNRFFPSDLGYIQIYWSQVKISNGQTIQDVSLLPQRQSCFAPDGRKVDKK